MKKTFIAFTSVVLFCLSTPLLAQKSKDSIVFKKNAVFYELAGSGGRHSINYERSFVIKQSKFTGSVRGGLSLSNYRDFDGNFNPDFTLPLMANLMYGAKHRGEIGVGQTLSSIVEGNTNTGDPKRGNHFNTTFNIGYRYQRQNGGPMVRVGYTPVINFRGEYKHWFGASIGFTF